MKLFIQIRDGQPYEHPILEDNFMEAFPHIDPNNLPSEFAVFERIPQPVVGKYEIYEGVRYEWIDGIVKDVHTVRNMTNEEITALDTEERALVVEFIESSQNHNIGVTRV
jgi:hypothetical protein